MKEFKALKALKAFNAFVTRNIDVNDVLAIIGMSMLGYGLWMVYPAAAPIVLGLLIIKLAIWGK